MSGTTGNPDAKAQDDEFRAIEQTFTQTARGRWFLAEFSRRNRNADTALVLAAIEQLGATLPGRDAGAEIDMVKGALAELRETSARDVAAAAAITHPTIEADAALAGEDPFGAIPVLSGKASSTILDAAEQIQELAWTLRERGSDGAACDLLDQRASDIYAACSLEEVAMKRVAVLLQGARRTESRIAALCDGMGTSSPVAPRPETIDAGAGTELDFVFSNDLDGEDIPHPRAEALQPDLPEDEAAVAHEATPEAPPAAHEPPSPEMAEAERRRRERLAVLAEIDGLDLREKLRLFT
jgi:hypothetical protein